LQVGALLRNYSFIDLALIDLEEGEPTRTKVNRAIRTVAKWKECAEILNTPQSIKTAEEMLDDLQDVMETLGAKVSSKRVERSKGV
jgi:TATA-binding protein-associated factor